VAGSTGSPIAASGLRARGGRTVSLRFADAEYRKRGSQHEIPPDIDQLDVVILQREIAQLFPDVIKHTERPTGRNSGGLGRDGPPFRPG